MCMTIWFCVHVPRGVPRTSSIYLEHYGTAVLLEATKHRPSIWASIEVTERGDRGQPRGDLPVLRVDFKLVPKLDLSLSLQCWAMSRSLQFAFPMHVNGIEHRASGRTFGEARGVCD